MLFSNFFEFLALFENGDVFVWGSPLTPIPPEINVFLKNVKMIFSTERSFCALLEGGIAIAWNMRKPWGELYHGLMNNVKMIFPQYSNNYFLALMENGTVRKFGALNPIMKLSKVKTV